jgi:outer membrane protein OmpA-like peptidoglycan-associated protein
MMRVMIFLLASMLILSPAYAGWLGDVIKSTGERIGGRAIDEGANKAYDNATGKKDAKKSGTEGNESDSPAPASNTGNEGVQNPVRGTGPAEGGTDIVSSEEIYGKYDFIPGDKAIFFDDFSDTDVGEFPRRWSLKGPGGGGNTVEVVDLKGKRFLRSVPPSSKEVGLPSSALYVRLNTKGDMPEKFTVEFDAVLGNTSGYPNQYYLLMYDENGWPAHMPGSIYVSGEKGKSQNTTTSINKDDGRVHHVAVSVNGTFVKAYVDNQRVVNDPDAITRPLKYIGISLHANHGYSETVMFTNFRLAEGGKDIKSALNTEGKIVTHGILFDTGSDKIRPESLPTLKKILAILEESPDLKFSIEGHTDNQGTKGLNQPLSERRANAVLVWLTGKGISSSRLQSKGWGDAKPIDTNDTPEGRANNRRVEFIKVG